MRKLLVIVLALATLLVWAAGQRRAVPAIRPTIPTADRTAGNRIFLERADVLKKSSNDSFMVLVGDVLFTKGPMIMKCDSCHYYPDTESLNAYGNVSMEQGDTLFVFADELNYDGPSEMATLYADFGKKVRLINRDVELSTDVFVYDLGIDLCYYEVGGTLTDPQNVLTSRYGEYAPATKEANFFTNVHLNSRNASDTLDIYSDTLYYNTATHIAELLSPSTIINARGTIYTSLAVYETDSDRATLFDRSLIVTDERQTLTADTIYYDHQAGFGEAYGAIVLADSANRLELRGNFAYYDELTDSAFVTGRAEMIQYSDVDTLYAHGRYIETWRRLDTTCIAADTLLGIPEAQRVDTTHVAVLYPRVRFFRNDMQGVCDSMRFTSDDSTLRMIINPVVWNEEQQIFGNLIEVLLNDSTIERATLPDMGFTAQHIEGDHYNQISGKEMKAYFTDGDMTGLDINGNVEIIMYPEENDSTYNKIVNAESSFLTATFKNRQPQYIKMWPETTGSATPLYLAKKSLYFLPKFQWFGDMRPASRQDIFTVPESMEQRMADAGRAPATVRPFSRRGQPHQRPIPYEDSGEDPNTIDLSHLQP